MGSPAGRLNWNELAKWAQNFVQFDTPAILVFIAALQSGQDMRMAIGALVYATYMAILDLAKKLLTDNSQKVV